MKSDVNMTYTKLVAVNAARNFAFDRFFIWKHLESQMFVSKFLDFGIHFFFWKFQTITDGDTHYIII